jgi:hypothetical protein
VMRQGGKTRRQLLLSGVAVAGGLVAAAATAGAQEKIDPKMVQYQTSPKDGNKCSLCVNFDPPNACKIVSGTIDPNGWCIAFAPKQS